MRWMLFLLLSLTAVGCRFRDPSIDLLEGELRWMEDQLYMMEGELEGACRELGRCQDAKQACAEQNRELQNAPRSTKSNAAGDESETRVRRPRIVMPFQGDSEDSSHPMGELPTEPVVELPSEPVVEIPESSVESDPAYDSTGEWEVIPSVPEGPVPPLPETLFEEGDPFIDDGTVVDSTDLPGVPIMGSPNGESGDAGESEDAEDDDETASGDAQDGTSEFEPTPAVPADESYDENAADNLPSLFPAGETGDADSDAVDGLEDGGQAPPAGMRPLLDRPGEEESAQPDENDVSIRLLSHLEHVRGARTTAADRIDAHITHIVCKSNRTSNGMTVLVEPRNAEGAFVGLPGKISIVVLDADKKGPEARVARWDTTAEQSADKLIDSLLTRGIRMEHEWPDSVPASDNLQVYVRYVTVDGRHVQTKQPLGEMIDKVPAAEPFKLFAENGPDGSSDWQVQESNSDYEVVDSGSRQAGWSVVRRDRESKPEATRNSWGQSSDVGQKMIVTKFATEPKKLVPAKPKPFRAIKEIESKPAATAVRVAEASKVPKPLSERPVKKVSSTPVESTTKPAATPKRNVTDSAKPLKRKKAIPSGPRLVKPSEAVPQIPKWSPERN